MPIQAPVRRPHPFLDAKKNGDSPKVKKAASTRTRAGTSTKKKKTDSSEGDATDSASRIKSGGARRPTSGSPRVGGARKRTTTATKATVKDRAASKENEENVEVRVSPSKTEPSYMRPTTASASLQGKESPDEHKGTTPEVAVSMDWSREYAVHPKMFKSGSDRNAAVRELNAIATTGAGAGVTTVRRRTPSVTSESEAADQFDTMATSSPQTPKSKVSSSGLRTSGRISKRSSSTSDAERDSPRRSMMSRSSSSSSRTRMQARSQSTQPGYMRPRTASPHISRASPHMSRGRMNSSGSGTASPLPPRSMPKKWVEAKKKGSTRASPEGKGGVQTAVMRYGLFRDTFELKDGVMGVEGVAIDEKFHMSDTYNGKYTFRVRGPGMMGPFLKEHGDVAEGDRSYLADGGAFVVDMRPGREYWVEVVPDPEIQDDVQQAIDTATHEIARLASPSVSNASSNSDSLLGGDMCAMFKSVEINDEKDM